MTPEFVDAIELAKHIKIAPRTLHIWAKQGLIPPGKVIGRKRFWNWNEVRLHILGNHTKMESPTTLIERIQNETLTLIRSRGPRVR